MHTDPLAATLASVELGVPIAVDNLTMIPLLARQPREPRIDYIVLDEAMMTGKVKITEISDEGMRVVDYLYLSQLPTLLLKEHVWAAVRPKLHGEGDLKVKLRTAVEQIMPVRNEIAHVREVSSERLQRANVACADVQLMIGSSAVA